MAYSALHMGSFPREWEKGKGKKKYTKKFSSHLTAYQGKLVSIIIENINAK